MCIRDRDKDDSRGKNGWEDTWKKRYHAGIMLLDLEQHDALSLIHISEPTRPY